MTLLPQQAGPIFSCEFAPALEDYLWHRLTDLWGFLPLQRQSPIPKPFHDILALDGDRLVAIILKRAEDYWVGYQALTYAQVLLQKRLFADRVNYNQPIRILVISPGYHPETKRQCESAPAEIEFWKISCPTQTESWVLELMDGDRTVQHDLYLHEALQLTEDKPSVDRTLPPKTKKLQQLLAQAHPFARAGIETIWQTLLSAHPAMMEFTYRDGVRIGLGKSCPCFEVMEDVERQTIALFLWLPFKIRYGDGQEPSIVRVRIWTDWQRVTDMGYMPDGLGQKLTFTEFRVGVVKPMKRALGYRSYNRYFTDPAWRKVVADEQEARYNRHPWADAKYEYALTVAQYEKLMNISLLDNSLMTFVNLSLKNYLKQQSR
jgi:hypothetical protein